MEPAAGKIDPQMSYGGFLHIPFRLYLGIEQPRLLVGSGTQNEFPRVSRALKLVFLAKTRQIQQLFVQREAVSDLAGQGGFPLQRDGGENRSGTAPHCFVCQDGRLAQIPVGPGQVVAVPSLRDSLPLDLLLGIEYRLAEQLRALELAFVNVAAQWFHTPFVWQPTYIPHYTRESNRIFIASASPAPAGTVLQIASTFLRPEPPNRFDHFSGR